VTNKSSTIAVLDRPADSRMRQWWGGIATAILVTLFTEAIFAGALLSGIGWARAAHAVTAGVVIAATLTAGLVALIALRRIPRGLAFALALLSLAIAAALQLVVGVVSAKGANLLWLHVPLGVALVGFAGQVAATARRLGDVP